MFVVLEPAIAALAADLCLFIFLTTSRAVLSAVRINSEIGIPDDTGSDFSTGVRTGSFDS